jgi:NADH:ubiquinone oxidoreductase subunit 4 (subunit M)
VQKVFWTPLVHDENRELKDIRPTELVAAAVLVACMIWIGVRPNDVLSKLSPTVEAIRSSVLDRTAAREPAGSGGSPENAAIAPGDPR